MKNGPTRGPFFHFGSGAVICAVPTVPLRVRLKEHYRLSCTFRRSRLGREHLQADVAGLEQSVHRREGRLGARLQRFVYGNAIDAGFSSNC